MDNNCKSSSEIVDELFKELASKNFNDGRTQDNIKSGVEEAKIEKRDEMKMSKNVDKEKEKRRKDEKKNRKRKRSKSSEDESSREKKHHHHHKKKKRKSNESFKKKHKHKHRRSKMDTDEEIEWESDPESKRNNKENNNNKKIAKEKNNDLIETVKIDIENVEKSNVTDINEEIKNNLQVDTSKEEKKIVCIVKDEWNCEADEGNCKSRIEIKDIKDCFVLQGTECPEKESKEDDDEQSDSSETEEQSEAGSNSKLVKKNKSKHKKKKSSKESHKRSSESARRRRKSRSVSKSRTSRSISKTGGKSRSRSSERRRHERKQVSDHRGGDREGHQRSNRHRSKSIDRIRHKSRTPTRVCHEKIDKAKLLEIARKNAMMMVSQGQITATGRLLHSQQNTVSHTGGGKSVAELTNFCKQLVTKGDSSSSDEENTNYTGEEESGPFIQHPFKLKDPQPNIVMNIKNAVQVPVKTPAEKAAETAKLRIQFPVSSGSSHRKKEFEWLPVNPTKEVKTTTPPPPPPPPPITQSSGITSISLPLATDPLIMEQSQLTQHAIDVASVLSQRVKAIKKLEENPNDVEALNAMYKAAQQLQSWAESKQLPGLFTGSAPPNARLLTPEELAGPVHSQAWVKKDQFNKAPPVARGIGMYLLRKMGWSPGEGLGKNKEGVTLPLMLDIKMDKKGLTSAEETARKNAHVPIVKDLSGKHPVSALVELCSKRKWEPPDFILVHDSGPDHKKNFLFKVRVNNVDYQPSIASSNKKHAKAQAAIVCLQAMGLYPRDLNNPL